MTLNGISIQSIRKQLAKKIFLSLAIGISLLMIISLISYTQAQKHSIEDEFDQYGANIVITPKTDSLSLSYGGVNLNGIVTRIEEIQISQLDAIQSIPNAVNIRSVSPKLIGIGDISSAGRNSEVLFIGVDFAAEREIKNWWKINGAFPSAENQIIAGKTAAEKLSLAIGDILTIKGHDFRVSGILEATGSQDDQAVFASLERSQEVLGRSGAISLVEVSALCRDCPIDEIVSQIGTALPGTDVKAISQVMTQKMSVIERFSRFITMLCLIIALICAFLVFMTISASVTERKKEIGIFRAIGFGRLNIIRIILVETFLLSGAGAVIGFAAAPFALSAIRSITGNIFMSFNSALILPALLAIAALSLFAGIIPALRAAATDPVKAINSL